MVDANGPVDATQRLIDAFNQRAMERCRDLITEDSELIDMAMRIRYPGLDGFRQFNANWFQAFPNGKMTVLNLIESNEYVIAQFTGYGIHQGPLMLAREEEIQATGQNIELPFCAVIHFREGRIDRIQLYYDQATLILQLGMKPLRIAA